MINKRQRFTLSKQYAVIICLFLLVGLALATLLSASGASASGRTATNSGPGAPTAADSDTFTVTVTPTHTNTPMVSITSTRTPTPNTTGTPCTDCYVKFVKPNPHQEEVSLSCNPDGTLHWTATMNNKPDHDNDPGCTLVAPYRVSLQVHCTGTDGAGCVGAAHGDGWTTVQVQRGAATLPPRQTVTFQDDFCYHWPSNADKVRIEFALDSARHECSKKKKSRDVSICPVNPPCPPEFPDVTADSPFYTVISGLSMSGVISGYADGTFKPGKPLYRGQLAKIVVLAFGIPVQASVDKRSAGGTAQASQVSMGGYFGDILVQVNKDGHFNDVPADHPYYAYIEAAFFRGLIDGYADGSFRPYNDVTRGQVAKIVVQAAGLKLIHPGTPGFKDVPANSPFYDYIETAFANGILSGYPDNMFKPDAGATRGQIAKITYLASSPSDDGR